MKEEEARLAGESNYVDKSPCARYLDSIESSARKRAGITGAWQTLCPHLAWALKNQRLSVAVGLEGLSQTPIVTAVLVEQSL